MRSDRQRYKGHFIELRPGVAETVLLIDERPVRYQRLPDGSYALQEYAYDWSEDLMDLARRFIDYRNTADEIRRGRGPGKRGE
jgi:hypothetical protein